MANGNSFFAFIAGAAVGAAAIFFAMTEKGNELFEEGCNSVKQGVKGVEDIINRVKSEDECDSCNQDADEEAEK